MTIAPHFRVLTNCEVLLHDNSLEQVDALLGCPVYLPTADYIDSFGTLEHDEQNIILPCLFTTVNWFRELINSFSTQTDVEYQKKVTAN